MSAARQRRPVVSVIIPAFNAERVLGLQLDSLADQDGAPAYEVLVVDNNSTDGTATLVGDRTPAFPVPLRLIRAAEHQGPGYARNVGVARARADLLLFADADDAVSRWWVRNGAQAFESSDLWSGGAVLMTDEQMAQDLAGIRAALGDVDEWTGVEPGDPTNAFPVVMGCDFGMTRAAYERVGGFDVSLGTVYEDNDLGVRAQLAGLTVDSAPTVRIAYRGKWEVRLRARLARRSARSHALVAARYGLRSRSHFPSPWRELPRAVGSATLMVLGRKTPDWAGVWIRANTAAGHAVGRLQTGLPGVVAPASVGVGLDAGPEMEERRA